MDSTTLVGAGSWSAYWYNGYIYSSEIARGLDILELVPSPFISQNEIDAAKLWRADYLNAQNQRRIVWPASFAVPRALLDQLARSHGLAADRLAAVRTELQRLEALTGAARRDGVRALAAQLDQDVTAASDERRVRLLADAVRALATAAP
jgi:hypothetical protein